MHIGRIDHEKEDEEDERDDPGMPVGPELEYELSCSQVRRNGHRIVEPVVPAQRESIGRREKPCSIDRERSGYRILGSEFSE